MKFEYDKEVDAAYIYLQDTIQDGEAKKLLNLMRILFLISMKKENF